MVVQIDTKQCTKCKNDLPASEFYKRLEVKSGLSSWCIKCTTEYHKDTPYYTEESFNKHLLRTYGTYEYYYSKKESQNNLCAICKTVGNKRLSLDHDHKCCNSDKSCGKCLRGLLCQKCNALLGLAHDNIDILLTAIDYLKYYEENKNYQVAEKYV